MAITFGESVFTQKPDDPVAYVFTPEEFGADPSGTADNTAALQRAIDALEAELTHGVVFVPEGTYRFAGTVQLWRGIRLIGFGASRPVFFVAENEAGFAGPQSRYVVHFRVNKPKPGEELRDAQNTTFYSGIRNIDFRLGAGNPGLVACRFRVAQLCSLEDSDFHMSDNRAAVEMVGNEIERCRFFGGEFGILTGETVAYWPFYLGDCRFSDQSRACVSTYRAGMTIVRTTLADAPYGVYVPNKERENHYVEEFERLYLHDCRLENLSQAGISMNMVRYPQNWLHADRVYCRKVPRFFESFAHQYNKHIGVPHIEPDSPCYRADMDMGLLVDVRDGKTDRRFDVSYEVTPQDDLPAPSEPDYVSMPIPSGWVSIRDFGAAGDGVTDDTDAFERAIASGSPIYLPQGEYLLTRGIELGRDTSLLGLHCSTTRLKLGDDAPGFGDRDAPAAMVAVSPGGRNHVSGICFDGGRNPGVVVVDWRGDPTSIMEDCLFAFGGHGGARKGRDRLHDVYVHDGGAGVFKNLWIPDVWTSDGFHIANTSAPGQIWMISVEHHLEIEVVLENVANWRIVALQTEENLGSERAASLSIDRCRDVEIANLFQYRVQAIEARHPNASIIDNCTNLVFKGVHCFSIGPSPFRDAAAIDGAVAVRDHEIGTLRVNR